MRGGSTPRYLQLANTLYEEIRTHRFAVGSLLPTEHQLCEQFGVSRFTAREAVKVLVQQGLVTRQRGVGSRVQKAAPVSQYVQTMSDISDLSQYAVETSLEIMRTSLAAIDQDTATQLEAGVGETWLYIEGLRYVQGQEAPIAHTHVYIAPPFRSLRLPAQRLSRAIYTYIEEQYDTRVASVSQHIDSIALDTTDSEALGVSVDSLGLRMRRDYFDERGELLEQAINIHPSDRFTYRQTFRRDYRINDEW